MAVLPILEVFKTHSNGERTSFLRFGHIHTRRLHIMTFDYGGIYIAMQRILSVMDPVMVILFGSIAHGGCSRTAIWIC